MLLRQHGTRIVFQEFFTSSGAGEEIGGSLLGPVKNGFTMMEVPRLLCAEIPDHFRSNGDVLHNEVVFMKVQQYSQNPAHFTCVGCT